MLDVNSVYYAFFKYQKQLKFRACLCECVCVCNHLYFLYIVYLIVWKILFIHVNEDIYNITLRNSKKVF